MKQAVAWLLTVAPGRLAAIGERELNHLIHEPQSYAIPRTPRHCARVIEWEGQILPVWDLGCWLLDAAPAEPIALAAVVGYQRSRRERPRFGALALPTPPVRVQVRDDQACQLPQDTPAWRSLALSCFTHQDRPVPIIDLAHLFSNALVTGRPVPRNAAASVETAPAAMNAARKLAVTP